MDATLERLEQGLAALEALIAPVIDIAAGDWIAIPPEDRRGHIIKRQGQVLIVDLGIDGILELPLFKSFVQRIPAPEGFRDAGSAVWHRRWLWFACHPETRGGRGVCPCCGLPGLLEKAFSDCCLCGWRHDGGDFDPGRLSGIHDYLTLARGRRRFEALGYAALPEQAIDVQAWRNPLVLARKRRLTGALEALTHGVAPGAAEPSSDFDRLWSDYLALLANALTSSSQEALPDHDG
jgi:hypothetical protein